MECVLHAGFLLLHLGLGGGPDLDHRDPARQLGQALLELLAVVVRGRLLDLGLDLADAALDVLALARALDDGGVVLVDDHLLGLAEVGHRGALELPAEVLGDDLAAGEDGDVLEHGLAPVAETRGLDRGALERAPELVHHQGGQGLALDVLGDDEQGTSFLGYALENGDEVPHVADLLVIDEQVRVFEHGLHAFGIGDEVGGEVAAVELHALDQLEGGVHALGLIHGDDAFLAHLVHGVGDDLPHLGVAVGGDGADLLDLLLVLHALAHLLEVIHDGGGGLVDAALEVHGVHAGGQVLEPLGVDGLGKDRGRGGAVTGHVGGLGCHLAHHLGTHVFELVPELDLLGHRDAVLGDVRRTEHLVEDRVAPLGAQGRLHGVSELVHTHEHLGPGFLTVYDLFCRHVHSSLGLL